MLLRSRSLLPSSKTIPFFCSLLEINDKGVRQLLLWHITSDIAKINAHGKPDAENRKIQCLLYEIVLKNKKTSAKHALSLLIEMYRRRIWNTEFPVYFISEAVFLKSNTFCIKIALYFLLRTPLTIAIEKNLEEETADPGKRITALKKSFQFRKKTRGREHKLKRSVHEIAKDYNDDDEGETEVKGTHKKIQPLFDPLLLLRDPQDFAERLLKLLQRTTELFDVRLLMMKVISRLISLHNLVLLPFYTFLQRYMQPYQREISTILALCTESFHDLIPPEEVIPLVKTIANHFIYEKASPDAITIALSTIRELCKRQPLIMDKDFLADLAMYTKHREDRGVVMAAKSLVKLFREIDPQMLPSKFRGRHAQLEKKIQPYGTKTVSETIPGLDKLAAPRVENDNDNTETDNDSEEDTSGEIGSDFEVEVDGNTHENLGEKSANESEMSEQSMECEETEEESESEHVLIDEEEEDETQEKTTLPLYDHILSEAEFRQLRKLNQAKRGSRSGPDAHVHVDSSIIEEYSTAKRDELKEEKLEKIREIRTGRSVGAKKKKRMGTSSHAEKLKSKPYQMSRRSKKATSRFRQSVSQKNKREKRNAKKNIKFRIRRGYKQ